MPTISSEQELATFAAKVAAVLDDADEKYLKGRLFKQKTAWFSDVSAAMEKFPDRIDLSGITETAFRNYCLALAQLARSHKPGVNLALLAANLITMNYWAASGPAVNLWKHAEAEDDLRRTEKIYESCHAVLRAYTLYSNGPQGVTLKRAWWDIMYLQYGATIRTNAGCYIETDIADVT